MPGDVGDDDWWWERRGNDDDCLLEPGVGGPHSSPGAPGQARMTSSPVYSIA